MLQVTWSKKTKIVLACKIHVYSLLEIHYLNIENCCSGLILAGCQTHTELLCHCPSSTGQRKKNKNQDTSGLTKKTGRLPTTSCHGQKRLTLGKKLFDLWSFKVHLNRKKQRKKKKHLAPTPFLGSISFFLYWCLYLLSHEQHRGMDNGGYGQYFLSATPCSLHFSILLTWVSPQAAVWTIASL